MAAELGVEAADGPRCCVEPVVFGDDLVAFVSFHLCDPNAIGLCFGGIFFCQLDRRPNVLIRHLRLNTRADLVRIQRQLGRIHACELCGQISLARSLGFRRIPFA